jgi:hypothetical protein
MKGKYYMPETIGKCLGCGSELPDAFLDLGEMPLANSYIKAGDKGKEEIFYKLALAYCPLCHLVQITHRVAPEDLFGNYLYFSSFSDAFLTHAREMADALTRRFNLGPNSLVMEIGSNDGYLLDFFQQSGVLVLGIEPAKNIAKVASEKGIRTLDIFFGAGQVKEILSEGGQADVIIGNNVLAHIPLINESMLAISHCLKSTGSAVFEFPYLKDLMENTEFDTIYHEHVFYYSLNAMRVLAERAGLGIYDVERQGIHGGSLRVFLQKGLHYKISDNVKRMLSDEEKYGIKSARVYEHFAFEVKELRRELVTLLEGLKKSGKTIAGYGAAAKGNTLLNYMGINSRIIDFVVDRSTYKQGLLMPGTRIPILHQDELLRRKPDYTIILAWNFAQEIMEQQSQYHSAGGKFIIPIPRPKAI